MANKKFAWGKGDLEVLSKEDADKAVRDMLRKRNAHKKSKVLPNKGPSILDKG